MLTIIYHILVFIFSVYVLSAKATGAFIFKFTIKAGALFCGLYSTFQIASYFHLTF